MPIGVGLRGLTYLPPTEYVVALTIGASTASVTFPEAFSRIPATMVIPPVGVSGVAITSVTTTGFTWAITGTGLGNTNITVGIAAHELL